MHGEESRGHGGRNKPDSELLQYTAYCKTVVLVVVVRGVDARGIQVQVVRVLRIVRGTRPVVAVGAEIVGAASVVVATKEETC